MLRLNVHPVLLSKRICIQRWAVRRCHLFLGWFVYLIWWRGGVWSVRWLEDAPQRWCCRNINFNDLWRLGGVCILMNSLEGRKMIKRGRRDVVADRVHYGGGWWLKVLSGRNKASVRPFQGWLKNSGHTLYTSLHLRRGVMGVCNAYTKKERRQFVCAGDQNLQHMETGIWRWRFRTGSQSRFWSALLFCSNSPKPHLQFSV